MEEGKEFSIFDFRFSIGETGREVRGESPTKFATRIGRG
jgi:hypothetical protein